MVTLDSIDNILEHFSLLRAGDEWHYEEAYKVVKIIKNKNKFSKDELASLTHVYLSGMYLELPPKARYREMAEEVFIEITGSFSRSIPVEKAQENIKRAHNEYLKFSRCPKLIEFRDFYRDNILPQKPSEEVKFIIICSAYCLMYAWNLEALKQTCPIAYKKYITKPGFGELRDSIIHGATSGKTRRKNEGVYEIKYKKYGKLKKEEFNAEKLAKFVDHMFYFFMMMARSIGYAQIQAVIYNEVKDTGGQVSP